MVRDEPYEVPRVAVDALAPCEGSLQEVETVRREAYVPPPPGGGDSGGYSAGGEVEELDL